MVCLRACLLSLSNLLRQYFICKCHRPTGPSFWGLINPEWSMCNRGRRQSPINIEPSELLFDPNLRPLHIDKNAVRLTICEHLPIFSKFYSTGIMRKHSGTVQQTRKATLNNVCLADRAVSVARYSAGWRIWSERLMTSVSSDYSSGGERDETKRESNTLALTRRRKKKEAGVWWENFASSGTPCQSLYIISCWHSLNLPHAVFWRCLRWLDWFAQPLPHSIPAIPSHTYYDTSSGFILLFLLPLWYTQICQSCLGRKNEKLLVFFIGIQVAGYLTNVGQGLIFTVDNSSKPSVNLTGGPLSYKYEWHQMALHFGLNNQTGSEHTIAGRSFPAEVRQQVAQNKNSFSLQLIGCWREILILISDTLLVILSIVYSYKSLDSTLNCTALTAKRWIRRTASSPSPFSSR